MNQSRVEQKFAVKLEHVSFSYGKTLALNDFSLEIAPGKLVGLIGPDGVVLGTYLIGFLHGADGVAGTNGLYLSR